MPSPRRGSRPAEAGPGVGRHCRRASLRSSPRCTAPRILRCMHSGHRFRRHNRIDRRRNRRSSARLCSPAVRRARRCRCTRRRHLPTCRIAPPRSRDRDMRWYSRGNRGHCLPHPSFRLVHRHRTLSPRHLRHRRHPVWSPHTRAWRKKAPHPLQPPPTTSRQHHRDLLLPPTIIAQRRAVGQTGSCARRRTARDVPSGPRRARGHAPRRSVSQRGAAGPSLLEFAKLSLA